MPPPLVSQVPPGEITIIDFMYLPGAMLYVSKQMFYKYMLFFLQMVAHYIQHSELCCQFMIYLGDQSLSVHEASFL